MDKMADRDSIEEADDGFRVRARYLVSFLSTHTSGGCVLMFEAKYMCSYLLGGHRYNEEGD